MVGRHSRNDAQLCKPNYVWLLLNVAWLLALSGCALGGPAPTPVPAVILDLEPSHTATQAIPTTMITPLVTTTPASPSPTPTTTVTPELIEMSAKTDLSRLYIKSGQGYLWFDLDLQTLEQVGELEYYFSHRTTNEQGNGGHLKFSNYSGQAAFWTPTNPAELWLTDVDFEKTEQILVDESETLLPDDAWLYPDTEIDIVWSPDDEHLFILSKRDPNRNLVYHLQTGELQSWYWSCDLLTISPRSNRVAVLCPKPDDVIATVEEYAVVEWGGDIWFSNELPAQPFFDSYPGVRKMWRWSADGEWIAYYDPADVTGHLVLVDAMGNIRQLLPGQSLFTGGEFRQVTVDLLASVFHWSRNGEVLLFFGRGQADYPCPVRVGEEVSQVYETPCWHALDVETGSILWNESDLSRQIEELVMGDLLITPSSKAVAVSPNGEALVVSTWYLPHLQHPYLIDLNTNAAIRLSILPHRISSLYWDMVKQGQE